jgi:hypothetical protein
MKKISNVELQRMVEQGLHVSEIARKLKVTPGCVSKRLKALKVGVAQNINLHRAGELVEKKVNAIEQLQRINDHANELLDRAMQVIRGEAIPDPQAMEPPQDIALKAMKEIRGQLKLQLEIFQALYDMTAVAEFQKEVLDAIGQAAPEVRREIVDNLQKRRIIRSTLELS